MRSLEKPEKAKEETLAEEVAALEQIEEKNSPSERYKTGELKIDREFTLPDGSIIKSHKDNQGLVRILL